MTLRTIAVPPSTAFWDDAARVVLSSEHVSSQRDLSAVRVLVPTFAHAHLMKAAFSRQLDATFIPPTMSTMFGWLGMLPPTTGPIATAPSERLMSLYASLREHGWLKKLFGARRNTDLLPLAEILLTLSDELTQALLPSLKATPNFADERWQAALQKLTPVARNLLSDETQLVWSIWKSQLDANDAIVTRHLRMQHLARHAQQPLFWISPVEPDAIEQAFIDTHLTQQAVTVITLDWHASSVTPIYAKAWAEIVTDEISTATTDDLDAVSAPSGLRLAEAKSLEDEATVGAQTIIDWLQQGKQNMAIVAQDRVVARRIRALLERAEIIVSDETGWKLSTTRAAAAFAAWFDLIAARAETVALLDFLKSPFVFADNEDKADLVIAIELTLRRENIAGDWTVVAETLKTLPAAQSLVVRLAEQAKSYVGRKTLCEWIAITERTLTSLGMSKALAEDMAGEQSLQLLKTMAQDCDGVGHTFSFPEWRAFINLQLESAPFIQQQTDRRVVMLPLNGARLRSFDAVLMVGVDADHLPSQPSEILFFANAVRGELGLATRESRQRQQLRDFTELLCANRDIVLSWQSSKDGEPNAVSPWIERLQLTLAKAGVAPLALHAVSIPERQLHATPVTMPAPSAPQLRPARLSASGYNSLVACPYQFFATRMLGLSGIDELSDLPEKRDYGDWLHQILATFHAKLRDQHVAREDRPALLDDISHRIFAQSLDKSGAALGYFSRWEKAMPAYLAWVEEREAQGWHFVFGEEHLERTLRWGANENQGDIILHGYVDRIDENDSGERAVLDYKSTNATSLNNRLKQGEDHQLPFYGLLSEKPLLNALYVPLDTKDKVKEVEAPDFSAWQSALEEQIAHSMQAIDQGAPLAATGPESVCQYCDARGLCRKGAW